MPLLVGPARNSPHHFCCTSDRPFSSYLKQARIHPGPVFPSASDVRFGFRPPDQKRTRTVVFPPEVGLLWCGQVPPRVNGNGRKQYSMFTLDLLESWMRNFSYCSMAKMRFGIGLVSRRTLAYRGRGGKAYMSD